MGNFGFKANFHTKLVKKAIFPIRAIFPHISAMYVNGYDMGRL